LKIIYEILLVDKLDARLVSLILLHCKKALHVGTLELLRNLGVISSDLQPFSKRIKPITGNIDKFLIIGLLE
jgi:hypothetical protein